MKYPRSPYDQAGGLVYLPRMLDKIRRKQAGTLPEDYFANLGKGFDSQCCNILGVSYEEIAEKTRSGASDGEVLAWCRQRGRTLDEYLAAVWNDYMRKRGWRDDDNVTRRLNEYKHAAGLDYRDDIKTFFDFIDAEEGRVKK